MIICGGKDTLQISNVPGESGLFLHIALINPVPGKILDEHGRHPGGSGGNKTQGSNVTQHQGTRCTAE
jgi:hypothetical protein